jgi:hypothetical protein
MCQQETHALQQWRLSFDRRACATIVVDARRDHFAPKGDCVGNVCGDHANAARQFAGEYFERFPKDRYQTEIESWRHLQSDNIEFIMKRLREPIDPMHTKPRIAS